MNITFPKYCIKCWSEQKSQYAPTAHPLFDSPSQAREYGNKNIKRTDFIVERVR